MKNINIFIFKCLYVAIIFLSLAIMCKKDISYRDNIYNNIYNDSINFSFFKNLYNKYLGGVFPSYRINDTVKTFNEKINYNESMDYYDGVKLEVDDNYLIPLIKNGIVVYIGDKGNYGNVIIVESDDGVDTWYGNVCNVSVNMYDNLEAGNYIGESCGNYIYLVYSKENNFLDYRDYF